MNRITAIVKHNAGRLAGAALALLTLAVVAAQWGAGDAGYAATRAPQTGNWQQQAPYPTDFAVDGVDMVSATEAWAVASTEILHTTDGGATWESRPRPGWRNLYSVDFFDSQHGIAMGNTTLYTRDGGQTWHENTSVWGYDIEMADANLAFLTDHRVAGYSRTTDGGASWNFHTMPHNITTIQCFDSLNCVANSPNGSYHSYDGGLNWTYVAGQGGEFASTYFVDHSYGWLVYGDTASRTTDGGATWQPQVLPGGSWVYDVVFSDRNNGWGVGANVVRTTNGGTTWQVVLTAEESLPLWDVDFVDAQHGIAGGDSFINTDAVIITTGDGGATWQTRSQGSINNVMSMVALDGQHAWASYDYGGKTSHTTDGGATWRVSEVGDTYTKLNAIDMADLLHGWTAGFETTFYDARIYHTTDGAATWQMQYSPGAAALRSVAALDNDAAVIVGGTNSTGSIEHRTLDGGVTWHQMSVPITSYFFDVFFLDNQIGWMVGGNGDIVKSTDSGDTWVVQPNPAQYTLTTIHFSDPNNGFAGGSYGTLVQTTNGGATWTLRDPQLPEYTHVLDVYSTGPMRGWIAGYGGGAQSRPFVKYTTDGGVTWLDQTPAVGPFDGFAGLAFLDDTYGWAGGAGGIFRHTDGTPPTPTPTPVQPTNTPAPPTPTQVQPTSTSVQPTVTPAPTVCAITFSDLPPGSPFYAFARCLACRGILSGYVDGTFRPGNEVTRGQLSKIVANAAGFSEPVSGQRFTDVPPGHTFYVFIERLAGRDLISGYGDGTFRPGAAATRGQIAKVVASAAGFSEPVSGQRFTDVPPGHTFYVFIERLAGRNIISGYDDGTFRPQNIASRGQTAKIVANAFFPECGTP